MPMEDHDPDLVMNPIFLAWTAAEKDAGAGRGKKGGLTGGGRTGGLRLGIKIDDAGVRNKPNTQKVDEFLIKQAKREAAEKGMKAPETKGADDARAHDGAREGTDHHKEIAAGRPQGRREAAVVAEGTSTTEKF